MILIAHRGNVAGPNPPLENNPDYVDAALSAGFHSEIDIRKGLKPHEFIMGHDYGEHKLPFSWLEARREKLFIHAKDLTTLSYFASLPDSKEWNVFWHQHDAYALTLSGIIWAYPGSTLDGNCICVMPENADYSKHELDSCYGICSDSVEQLRRDIG